MKEDGENLDTYWTHVNKRLAKVYDPKDSNPAYIRLLMGKILANDQVLYGSPEKLDEFGQILLEKDVMVVSNMEKNVITAISGMSKKKATSDPNFDPALQGPLGNPPNSITITEGGVAETGIGVRDETFDADRNIEPNSLAAEVDITVS